MKMNQNNTKKVNIAYISYFESFHGKNYIGCFCLTIHFPKVIIKCFYKKSLHQRIYEILKTGYN